MIDEGGVVSIVITFVIKVASLKLLFVIEDFVLMKNNLWLESCSLVGYWW